MHYINEIARASTLSFRVIKLLKQTSMGKRGNIFSCSVIFSIEVRNWPDPIWCHLPEANKDSKCWLLFFFFLKLPLIPWTCSKPVIQKFFWIMFNILKPAEQRFHFLKSAHKESVLCIRGNTFRGLRPFSKHFGSGKHRFWRHVAYTYISGLDIQIARDVNNTHWLEHHRHKVCIYNNGCVLRCSF